jgi:type IV secretory pathway VirB2 component (pilin)
MVILWSNKSIKMLSLGAVLGLLITFPNQALATTTSGAGGGLPWEAPLQTLANSLSGPVALSLSLMGIIVAGGVLIWGGEITHWVRSLVFLVMVISVLAFAGPLLSSLFGVSTII